MAANSEWFWRELESYLEKNQLKQTKPRRIIVEKFLALNTHVDAEEMMRQLRRSGHNFGLATIYRTLKLLTDAGVAEQKSFQDGRSVFEVHAPDHHHDHLICVKCGKVVEFENHAIEELQLNVASEHGFVLKSHRLDLFGICDSPACRKSLTKS